MEEVVFEIDHSRCSFNNISHRYPNLKMWHWCSRRVDVFEVAGSNSEPALKEIEVIAKSMGGSVELNSFKDGGRAILSERGLCPCNRVAKKTRATSITTLVEEYRCMPLEPISYSEGKERRRMVSFGPTALSSLLERMEEMADFAILSKKKIDSKSMKDFFTIPLSDLFSELTEKQYGALSDALNGGYYDVPRNINVETLSKKKSIPRTTFEEHLHKGQGKVMRALAPFLLLYSRRL